MPNPPSCAEPPDDGRPATDAPFRPTHRSLRRWQLLSRLHACPAGHARVRRFSPCCRGCYASPGAGRRLVLLGIAYVMTREWCLTCMGMLDPCSGSDDISSTSLQFLARAFARPTSVSCVEYLLRWHCVGYVCSLPTLFRCSTWACGAGRAKSHASCVAPCSSLGAFGLSTHDVLLGLSGTVHHVGTRPSASEHHNQAFYASCERPSVRSLAVLS